MNATTSPPPPAAAERPSAVSTPTQAPDGDSCPLCGAPLHAEQEWCLRCGAAARTRLAAAPKWKAPVAALAVVIALSLGVLAAALVKLAGDSGSSPATPIVTTAPAAASTPASPPAATAVPGATSSTATTPTTTAGATTPGAGTPRTSAPATSLPGSSGSRTRGQTRTPKVPPNLGGATGAKGPGILSAKQLRELRELRERIQSGGTK